MKLLVILFSLKLISVFNLKKILYTIFVVMPNFIVGCKDNGVFVELPLKSISSTSSGNI